MATRELRLAPVMTGGTSLAVWMGGATAELYRMLRSEPTGPAGTGPEHVYTRLLRLTATRPVADVITGTSAGGLNGTLLAAALRLGVTPATFAELRDTWMRVADLGALLRTPQEPNPPSLLKGDDSFIPSIVGLLGRWERSEGRSGGTTDLDVVATVTTLVAEPRYREDDFDEPINEVSHAQCLRFGPADLGAADWKERLAVASRTSASIPGVFEPSYLPVGGPDLAASGRPDFADNASFRASRWAVDGGVVVNLPLTEALRRIFNRRADVDVRRVVLYLAPTPSSPVAADHQRLGSPPTIRESLLSVVTAPRAEGVAADLDQLRDQNAAVDRQVQARRHLAPIVALVESEVALAGHQQELFNAYKDRRSVDSVAATIDGIRRELRMDASGLDFKLRADLLRARRPLFPATVADFGSPPSGDAPAKAWAWGIRPIEQAISIALRLLAGARALLPPDAATSVGSSQDAVFAALRTVNRIREADQRYWSRRFDALAAAVKGLDRGAIAQQIRRWAPAAYGNWLAEGTTAAGPGAAGPADAFAELLAAHRQVAAALLQAGDALRAAAETPGGAALQQELGSVGLGAGDDLDAEALQRRLLAVHVAQTVVLGDVLDREQPVELMQVSFNSRNLLDPDRQPQDKLAGPELGRLGAFLKPSWRANDWFWGRMDTAYRLVVLLADPRRIKQLHPDEAAAVAAVTTACGGALPPGVAAELGRLYGVDGDEMRSLPELTRHLAEELQVEIAREELPVVADAVERSEGNEIATRGFLRAYDAAVQASGSPTQFPAATVGELVRLMRIGTETVRTELGFGPLNRVMTRGASVAVNAFTGTQSGMPLLPRLLRPVRAPFHAVASLVSTMVGSSPLARALAAFVLAAAGAIVSLRLVGADVPAGTFAVSAILLTGLVVAAMIRSGFVWLGACVLAGSAVIGLALVGDDLDRMLYGPPLAGDDVKVNVPEPVTLEAGSVIELEAGTIVITSGRGDARSIDTVDLPADGSIELRQPGRVVPKAPPTDDWKRWAWANPSGVSVFQVVTGATALLLAVRAVATLARRRWAGGVVRLVAAVVLGVAAVRALPIFEAILTGTPGSNELKDRLVGAAHDLEAYDLEVILTVIVASSVLLALGSDLVFSRSLRRAGRALGRTLRGGAARA